MKTIRNCVLVLLLIAVAQTAFGQTADEIIEKHLAAMGGRAALEKVKSRTSTGTIRLTLPIGGEVTGTIETYNQVPNKTRILIKIDLSALGVGQMVQDQRFDGTTAFVSDTLQGNREITGNQLENMKNNGFPTALLNYKENGTIELQGKEKVGDRDAYVLVGKPKTGSAVRMYFDAQTYLPIKSVASVNVPQIGRDIETTTETSDFRDVDGVKVPFQIKSSSELQSFTVNMTKVEQNTSIDPAMFSKP